MKHEENGMKFILFIYEQNLAEWFFELYLFFVELMKWAFYFILNKLLKNCEMNGIEDSQILHSKN